MITLAPEAAVPRDPEELRATPKRLFLERVAAERFAAVARQRDALSGDGCRVIAAYSVKTNPDARLLRMAREHGFFAEVIGEDERRWAIENGFAADAVIRNGPDPAAVGDAEPVAFAFADSVESLRRNVAAGVSSVPGVRLRPLRVHSRFGVPVEEDDAIAAALASRGKDEPLALSMHVRRSDYNGASWRDLCSDIMARGVRLERTSGRHVVALDVGGAWDPDTFDESFAADGRWLIATARRLLSHLRVILIEPGQAIAMPVEALLTRCLEVRRRLRSSEAVLDVGYNDWPEQHRAAHGFFALRDGAWRRLPSGSDRLSGKTCLEWDVIDGVRLPTDLTAGDVLLITNAGAYDASMAFPFAHGGRSTVLAAESVA